MWCFAKRTSRVIGTVLNAVAVVAALSGGATLASAQSSTLPVYRFFNNNAGGHFFTIDEAEKNTVIQNYPWFRYEGIGFYASPAAQAGMLPVYRFFNNNAGGHFFTISEAEKNTVIDNYNWFRYEGSGFYASPVAQAGMLPVYRFFNNNAGGHFFTIDRAEKNTVIQNYPWFRYEGIGFYAYPPPGAANGTPIGRYRLNTRGLWTEFQRRGFSNGYYSGDMIRMFNQFDQQLQDSLDLDFPGTRASSTVGAEVGMQLDIMRGWGINSITVELRATDPTYVPNGFVPPGCNLGSSLGFQWPQPTPIELANLAVFFDFAQSKGIRIQLILNNTHMEENPRTNAQIWLGAILNVVKDHPALDVVGFGGNTHLIDTNGDGIGDACGIPAEPPLYLGPSSVPAQYVKWAIQYGISLGVPARKLSAEAIIGDFFVDSQPPAGPDATDRHLWSGIVVLKGIFDNLGIPDNQRTYFLSFYEHRKCATARNLPCTPDADPHTWAEQTITTVRSVVGNNGPRIIAAEMGVMSPIESSWPAERALESLAALMEKYGIDGGNYWTWTATDTAIEASSDRVGEPIKRRGISFVYNPVQKELVDLAGFHLTAIANGSFERGGSTADNWTAGGIGTVTRFRLGDELGQPLVPTRGNYALRLTTGGGASDAVSTISDEIDVSLNTTYTTTANLRFQWTGDTSAGTSNTSRPQIYMMVRYFGGDGWPSAVRSQDIFRYYQESGSADFGTFPISYTTPSDAMTVKLEFGAMRNGLPQPVTFDVDNVR